MKAKNLFQVTAFCIISTQSIVNNFIRLDENISELNKRYQSESFSGIHIDAKIFLLSSGGVIDEMNLRLTVTRTLLFSFKNQRCDQFDQQSVNHAHHNSRNKHHGVGKFGNFRAEHGAET